MHVFTFFLRWGSIGYSLGIVQWDFTRRDHPGNSGRVSGWGPVTWIAIGLLKKWLYLMHIFLFCN